MTYMASSGNCSNWSKNAVIFILLLLHIFSITLSQPISVDSVSESGTREKELVIGSRPPQCVNKCLNCHPCVAALVVSQRHRTNQAMAFVKELLPKDDSYYLLSWKCKCKDKYFQP